MNALVPGFKSKTAKKVPAPKGRPAPEVAKTKAAAPAGHSGRIDPDMQYRAKSALDDIIRAEGHKRDRELMKHVARMAAEHKDSIDRALSGKVTRKK